MKTSHQEPLSWLSMLMTLMRVGDGEVVGEEEVVGDGEGGG